MKLNLIYYKNPIDLAIEKFFNSYGSFFTKENDKYVLCSNTSKSKIRRILEKCISLSFSELTNSCCANDVFVVIGSCWPCNNLLLEFKDDKYFPKRLSKILLDRPNIKWLFSEPDIEIDISSINEMFVSLFNDAFNDKKYANKLFNNKTILVSHSKLDCYMMFKTIKWAYGNSNCTNLWKEKLSNKRPNFVAINDLIARYVHNKTKMNRSAHFKQCALEVKNYLDAKLNLK